MKLKRDLPFQSTALLLPKNASRSIRAQVVLGSPAAGCQDVGVCRVIPMETPWKMKCPAVVAWISLTEENKIRFSFLLDSIPEKIIHRHFGWGLFQVIEAYPLPEFVTRFLKTGRRDILPGIYTVGLRGDRLIVDFY
jgi:hypothetical protein